ncbi:hypothetical protein [Exiguobacterium sp. s196]|uniref:hypothetical protein n=1 Tax=Exiguobacterium sp. s196 TaxID=2751283 RepID=UPI001BE4FF05|nr:hypothetical protein [Exiguobacterium sp. s196]
MKKNIMVKVALSTTLLGVGTFVTPLSSYAEKGVQQSEPEISVEQYAFENNLIYNETTVVTYNALGKEKSKTVKKDAVDAEGNILLTDTDEEPVAGLITPTSSSKVSPGYGTYVVVNPGGINYKLLDTFKGDSRVIDTASEWVGEFAAAVIPFKFLKGFWSQAAGVATANTFLPEYSTKYYTTYVYQDEDYYNYYGKSIAKQYSDSARTKLVKTTTHISKLPK